MIVDPATGEVLGHAGERDDELATDDVAELRRLASAYRDLSRGLERDVEGLEREARGHRRKIKALEEELHEQRQEQPEMQMVRALFTLWVDLSGRNKKQTKLGEKREKTGLKAAQLYAYEDLGDAIRGGVAYCYVDQGGKRYDDFELILRDETKIERFRDLWRRAHPPEGQLAVGV